MVGKKGFLKILEAIIAIVIVFGLVIFILPKAERNFGNIPAELENTAKTILDQAQNEEEFRKCILGGVDTVIVYPACISNKINSILGSEGQAVWAHAEKICNTNNPPVCNFLLNGQDVNEEEFKIGIPANKDVYTKSIAISVPDITAQPPLPTCESIIPTTCVTKQLTLYFWSRI